MTLSTKPIKEFMNEDGTIDALAIKQIIPYDYPFLMIDKVLKLEDKKISGIKSVTANEEFFKGHFSDFPIMPGVLIVEAIGQLGSILVRSLIDKHHEKDLLGFKVDNVNFVKPVFPGDQITLNVDLVENKGKVYTLHGEVFTGKEKVCSGDFLLAVVDKKDFRLRYSKE